MERIVSATQARIRFGELMRQVMDDHQPVIVEHDGKPRVVVLSVAEYERMRTGHHDNWQTLVDQARAQIGAELGGRDLPPPEEILSQAREERNGQLMDLR